MNNTYYEEGRKIIEKALEDALNEQLHNYPFGMDAEEGQLYKMGMAAAYQHALEMY